MAVLSNLAAKKDVPRLLARRHNKHIAARASAALIDLIVIAIGGNLVNAAVGSLPAWFVFVVLIVYYTAFEARCGQTLGKRLPTRLRIPGKS